MTGPHLMVTVRTGNIDLMIANGPAGAFKPSSSVEFVEVAA